MTIGDVISTDPFGVVSAAEDMAMFASWASGVGTSSAPATSKSSPSRSLGDYTLIAVGIVLAIGALLISQKQTIVQVAGTVSKAVA